MRIAKHIMLYLILATGKYTILYPICMFDETNKPNAIENISRIRRLMCSRKIYLLKRTNGTFSYLFLFVR